MEPLSTSALAGAALVAIVSSCTLQELPTVNGSTWVDPCAVTAIESISGQPDASFLTVVNRQLRIEIRPRQLASLLEAARSRRNVVTEYKGRQP